MEHSPIAPLSDQADTLPTTCGVYLFKNEAGNVVYVGKAVNLRSRVRQYILGHDERVQVAPLIMESNTIDVVLTDSEKDALLLENTLIKRYLPKFNIQLKDDKNFLHLAINPKDNWPRFTLGRTIKQRPGQRTFGPWSSARTARKTLAFVEKTFPLRSCDDKTLYSRVRPCLLHQMKRCCAPCVEGHTTKDSYAALVHDAIQFMEGKREPLLKDMAERMMRHSEKEEFEAAGLLRDLIVTIRDSQKTQTVVDPKLSDRDAWGLYREGLQGILLLIPVRKGMMLDPLIFQFSGAIGQDSELIATWLTEHYTNGFIPREVLLPCSSPVGLAELLSEKACRKTTVKQPMRGDRARLVSLATRNAANRFERTIARSQRQATAMEELRKICQIEGDFSRIECFDNSNIQGTTPVASQVVFVDGEAVKRLYRTYKIKSVEGPDDYASMAEVLTRRLKRGLEQGDLPDLIVVDGGRGQLNVALSVADKLGLSRLPIIGLSKPRTERKRGNNASVDKIVLPWQSDPIRLPDHDPALNLLRRLRDESHRFAVNFHRKSRNKKSLQSDISDIPGVGKSRRRALLRHFGSLTAVKKASVEELAKVEGIGQNLAQEIFKGIKR